MAGNFFKPFLNTSWAGAEFCARCHQGVVSSFPLSFLLWIFSILRAWLSALKHALIISSNCFPRRGWSIACSQATLNALFTESTVSLKLMLWCCSFLEWVERLNQPGTWIFVIVHKSDRELQVFLELRKQIKVKLRLVRWSYRVHYFVWLQNGNFRFSVSIMPRECTQGSLYFLVRSVVLLAAIRLSSIYWAYRSTSTGSKYSNKQLEHSDIYLLGHCAKLSIANNLLTEAKAMNHADDCSAIRKQW